MMRDDGGEMKGDEVDDGAQALNIEAEGPILQYYQGEQDLCLSTAETNCGEITRSWSHQVKKLNPTLW